MAGIKDELPVETTPSCFFLRHQFLILRLHSLSGLLPVGAYMVVHLLTNATVLAGAVTFQDQVDKIHALGPVLPLVEWTFIFLPLIFHAVVGVMIIRSGISNTSSYRYVNNVRYTLQRATAWIALFFIFYHVFQMHGWFHSDWWKANIAGPLHGGQFNAEHATSSAALALRSVAVQVAYVIGVLSCVFHLCNGLWTMGITWGVWTSPAAAPGHLCVRRVGRSVGCRQHGRAGRHDTGQCLGSRGSRTGSSGREGSREPEDGRRIQAAQSQVSRERKTGADKQTAGRRRAAIAATAGPGATGENLGNRSGKGSGEWHNNG